MRLLWMAVDAATAWPWILAACALIVGLMLLRLTVPLVRTAWERALVGR